MGFLRRGPTRGYPAKYLLGYGAHKVAKPLPPQKSATVSRTLGSDPETTIGHAPVARAIGPTVIGAAPCAPDPTLVENQKSAWEHRMNRATPPQNKKVMRKFRRFVRGFVRSKFTPFNRSVSFYSRAAFIEWIEHTNYPAWRKKYFLEIWEKRAPTVELTRRERVVQAHIKREFYTYYNRPRGIYARVAAARVVLGPIFKKIEKEVYVLKNFIKEIPVKDRPSAFKARLEKTGFNFFVCDYEAWESLQDSYFMDCAEFELYKHMLRNHPDILRLLQFLKEDNLIYFKNNRHVLAGCRMSGEMNTSLGNGFNNLMVLLFLARERGYDIKPIVEGDDSLFSAPPGFELDAKDFENLGIIAKLDKYSSFSEGSFCGLKADNEDLQNTTNPVDLLVKLGWTMSAKMHCGPGKAKGLYRAKVLSLAYEYPSCPIIWSWCLRMLEHLGDVKTEISEYNWYTEFMKRESGLGDEHQEERIHRSITPPTSNTRLMMERSYGIAIEEQLACEAQIRSMGYEDIASGPLYNLIMSRVHEDLIDNYIFNTVTYTSGCLPGTEGGRF